MADKKISALTAATTPLAGTEVLPIVQSGSTVKVSVANLTAGRVVGMLRGNIEGAYNGSGPSTSSVPILRVNEGGAISLWMSGQAYNNMWMQAIQDDGSNNLKALSLNPLGGATYVGADAVLSTGNLVIGTSGKGIDFSANPAAPGVTSELLNDYEEGTWTPTDGSGAGLTFSNVTAKYTKVGNQVTVQVKLKYPVTASAVGAAIGGLPFTPSTDCSGVYYSGVSAGSTYYAGGVMYLANSAGGAVTNATVSNQFVIYNMTYTV